jgi:hypothetical protein
MFRKYLTTLVALVVSLSAFGWGQKGHDVTAFIAEQHLTSAAKAAVDSIYQGKSLVYWANWLDNASHQPDYAYTKTWHYKNVDADETYDNAQINPAGDIVTALKAQVEVLSNPATTRDEAFLSLKILAHIMGDLHMPLHMGHRSDLGGNLVKVKFFKRETNLHSAWDESLPEAAHAWSHTEWQQELDRLSAEEQQEVVKGDFDDWARETIKIGNEVYVYFQPDCTISYNDIARWTPTIEQQFVRGGLRLAHVLNTIFDAQYRANQGL